MPASNYPVSVLRYDLIEAVKAMATHVRRYKARALDVPPEIWEPFQRLCAAASMDPDEITHVRVKPGAR